MKDFQVEIKLFIFIGILNCTKIWIQTEAKCKLGSYYLIQKIKNLLRLFLFSMLLLDINKLDQLINIQALYMKLAELCMYISLLKKQDVSSVYKEENKQ